MQPWTARVDCKVIIWPSLTEFNVQCLQFESFIVYVSTDWIILYI